MTRWVALLRGIAPMNPNQKNEQLRGVCQELGLRNVTSVLSSGNLLFDADSADREELAGRLEAAWPRLLGFESTSILRTSDELASLVELNPFGGRKHGPSSYLLVTFARGGIEPTFAVPQRPEGTSLEVVGGTGRELFTVTDTTVAGSPQTMRWLESEFGRQITSRTWLSVQRIRKRC